MARQNVFGTNRTQQQQRIAARPRIKKAKKPSVLFLCDAKFSSSPRKLANKLTEIAPEKRYNVRLKTRPALPFSPTRKILIWGQNINKLQQYQAFIQNNIPHPEWTTDLAVARTWLGDGHTIVGRQLLNSFGGKGIVLFSQEDPDLPHEIPYNHGCKVFTKYTKKKHEYRVHVFNNRVIDFAQKKKKRTENNNNNVNTKIRNYHNGWVYCREDVTLIPVISSLAIAALNALNLKYGAVDIIWNDKKQEAYVLEVNTSPGLSGSTVETYANAFKQDLET